MSKKKILIISKFFHPEITPRSFRTTELAKELARQGHEVTVWLPDKEIDYIDFEEEHKLKIHYMGKLKWKGININGKFSIVKRGFGRVLQLLFEYPDLEMVFMVNKSLKKLQKSLSFDLLISIAVPHSIHWGVAMARSKKRPLAKVWVADCGDPYMGEKTDTFSRLFYFKYIEKWFMKKADFITIPIENARKAYYPEFHSKIRVIPQGFKMGTIEINNYKPNPIPHFAYAGNFNLKHRDPRPLLDFLSSLEYDFRFTIYSNRIHLLEPYLKRLNGRLLLKEPIPREELLQKLSKMDFLVNLENNTDMQQPSKLIDYLICNRPVIKITRELDKETVIEFLEGNYRKAMSIGDVKIYSIENVSSSFLRLLNEHKN